tara:strand:- start:344 stop:514 length:171 start_codon:yes stop_codon:yes gene_type:complete
MEPILNWDDGATHPPAVPEKASVYGVLKRQGVVLELEQDFENSGLEEVMIFPKGEV